MRKKYWLGLVLFMSLALYGCAGQNPTDQTQVPEVVDTAPASSETEAGIPTTQTEIPSTDTSTEISTGPAQCRPYNLLDEILAPPNPNLPPVSEEFDHIKGPEDAKLVIIEYSDFQ